MHDRLVRRCSHDRILLLICNTTAHLNLINQYRWLFDAFSMCMRLLLGIVYAHPLGIHLCRIGESASGTADAPCDAKWILSVLVYVYCIGTGWQDCKAVQNAITAQVALSSVVVP